MAADIQNHLKKKKLKHHLKKKITYVYQLFFTCRATNVFFIYKSFSSQITPITILYCSI